jgi:hypothetical protein
VCTIPEDQALKQWVACRPSCPVCHHQGWCSRTADGKVINCRRIEDGAFLVKQDINGAWCYFHRADLTPCPAELRTRGARRADPRTVHLVYFELLQRLDLEPHHRKQLRQRGFRDQDLDAVGFRSWPRTGRQRIAAELNEQFRTGQVGRHEPSDGYKKLLLVPGFYMEEGHLTIAGPVGFLIPILGVRGGIVALKCRLDNPINGTKYIYLSSTRFGGPGPGSPVYVPSFRPKTYEVVRVVEGEIKALLACTHTGILTVGMPGVGAWAQALRVAKERCNPATIRLAFDSDSRTNPVVAGAQLACAKEVLAAGLGLEVETWRLQDGKGLDDLLNNGKTPRLLVGDDALRRCERTAEKLGCSRRPTESPRRRDKLFIQIEM